jgi:hypothetical protein
MAANSWRTGSIYKRNRKAADGKDSMGVSCDLGLHLAIKDLCGKDNVVVIAGEGKLDCDFLSS